MYKPLILEIIDETRKYGFFLCIDCLQEWESASCWLGKWQMCRLCKGKKYAYKMLPLSNVKYPGGSVAPHLQNLCEKCIEIGTCCEKI